MLFAVIEALPEGASVVTSPGNIPRHGGLSGQIGQGGPDVDQWLGRAVSVQNLIWAVVGVIVALAAWYATLTAKFAVYDQMIPQRNKALDSMDSRLSALEKGQTDLLTKMSAMEARSEARHEALLKLLDNEREDRRANRSPP